MTWRRMRRMARVPRRHARYTSTRPASQPPSSSFFNTISTSQELPVSTSRLMKNYCCAALAALTALTTSFAQECASRSNAQGTQPSSHSDCLEVHSRHLRPAVDGMERRGIDAWAFCHQYPDRCPVNQSLVERLDTGDLDDLNVMYQFPTIPSAMLDHCTTIADRGERIKCVDDKATNFAIRMQAPMISELLRMPHDWFQDYQNFSITPRLIVKQVHNADVVWRTCLQPNVVEVHAEQTFLLGS